KLLATGSWDSFAVWELPTGKKLLWVQESESVSYIGRDRITVVRLSPDGKQLATANKTTGAVNVWDVATGKLQKLIAWDADAEKKGLEKVRNKPFERRKHSADHALAIEYVDNTHLRIQSQYFTNTWDTAKFERTATEFHPWAADFGITKDRKRVV